MNLLAAMYLKSVKFLMLAFFAAFSAAGVAQKADLPLPFSHLVDDDLVYNTTFRFGDDDLSGLLAIKGETDGYRVVMVSKFGFTIADFVLGEESVKWNKMFPGRTNKAVLRALERDFRLLLLTPLYNAEKVRSRNSHRYLVKKDDKILVSLSEDGKRVTSAKSMGFLNIFKSRAGYHYREKEKIPYEIRLTRNLMKMRIEMVRTEI